MVPASGEKLTQVRSGKWEQQEEVHHDRCGNLNSASAIAIALVLR